LLEFGRIDDAVEILRFNVELFPDSWNTYDSLGEAYLKQGNKELAAENYRRSLELNPDNQGAVDAVKKLESN
jgi:tetratricopeptide (TPR) repeat protein